MNITKYWDFFKSNISIIQPNYKKQTNCIDDLNKIFTSQQIKVIFDVGAHEGKVVKKLNQKFSKASIYAFEPFSISYEKLLQATRLNKNIRAYSFALSSLNGSENFFINNFSETNSLLPSKKLNSKIDNLTFNKDRIPVQTVTLDSFCSDQSIKSIDFLKLDTQGSELKILQGGSHLLQSGAISAIYCEIEFIEMYENQPLFDEIFRYLRSYNYFIYNLYNFNFLETGQLAWADALFILNNFSHSLER